MSENECPVRGKGRPCFAVRVKGRDADWYCSYCAAPGLPAPTRKPWEQDD